MRRTLTALFLGLAAGPVLADPVTDALDAARTAYEAGDLTEALAKAGEATAGMQAKQSEALAAFLPEPPDGWTRTLNPDLASGLAMMGGGSGVEAFYETEGKTITVTLLADSPMLEGFLPMFQSEQMLAMMGTVTKVGDVAFVNQAENEMMAVLGGRIMLTVSGAPVAELTPFIEEMDLAGLAAF